MKRISLLLLFAAATLAAGTTRAAGTDGKAGAVEVSKSTLLYAVKGADSLYMDRYTTVRTGGERRPCMIFLFGGGFVGGTRDNEGYLGYLRHMASCGMEVLSIDYRLGLRDATPEEFASPERFAAKLIGTIQLAVDDLFSATAFAVRHADEWGIDPGCIVACGSSAGAITVLQGEYARCNGAPGTQLLPEGFRYAGIISFAGAIFCPGEELVWQQTPAPMLLFHGSADRNVPYGAVRVPGAGFFGSHYIAGQLLDEVHSPFVFYSVTGATHEMAEKPMTEYRDEIGAFLRKLVYSREPLMVRTDITVLGQPVPDTNFTLEEYIRENYAGL